MGNLRRKQNMIKNRSEQYRNPILQEDKKATIDISPTSCQTMNTGEHLPAVRL